MKHLVMTGGGSAGHVIPNIALYEQLGQREWSVNYIGSYAGMERGLIEAKSINYYPISTGKLRRYFSWQNFIDPFRLLKGVIQSWLLLGKLKPDAVFSKGGFVAVPCVIAAWLRGIPVIAHESDFTPGLANKLSFPFSNQICVNFAPTLNYIKKSKKVNVTGTPIRPELLKGNKERAKNLCHFKQDKPCVLIAGGGLGAQAINECIWQALTGLLEQYNIIHLCGKGKLNTKFQGIAGYHQQEYADSEMADFYALSDVVISRAGANTVCEILALAKPHLFIPLSKKASRGDQIDNAKYFESKEVSLVIDEDLLTPALLMQKLTYVINHKEEITKRIEQLNMKSASGEIIKIIQQSFRG